MLRLLIDTREQKKLEFKSGVFGDITRVALPVGDYGCDVSDQRVPIIFERKGFSDLFSTLGSGEYDRFKREMLRAKELNIKLVLLIEGTMRDVAKGYDRSVFSGEAMLKKLATLYVKYDLEYHFCCDRYVMSRRIEDVFSAVARLWKKEGKL